MTPKQGWSNAVSVRDRLLNLARQRGEDFQLILTRYGLERLLYRLSQSEFRDRFILKGAMLFAIWEDDAHRATRDVDYPTLLDSPSPLLRAYPRETVVAEKFQALVNLGMANSRMKDFYDLWVLANRFEFDGVTLSKAIGNTFTRRNTTLPNKTPSGLNREFQDDQQKAQNWEAFLQNGLLLPATNRPSLPQVCQFLEGFLMPPTAALTDDRVFSECWQPGGPWNSTEA